MSRLSSASSPCTEVAAGCGESAKTLSTTAPCPAAGPASTSIRPSTPTFHREDAAPASKTSDTPCSAPSSGVPVTTTRSSPTGSLTTKGQEILEYISQRLGGDLRGRDGGEEIGWTAAHLAVIKKSPEILALLIGMNIPIDLPQHPYTREETPLALAVEEICEFGYDDNGEDMHEIVCQLMNAGADMFASTCLFGLCIDGILTHFDEAFVLIFIREFVCEPMEDVTNKNAPMNLLRVLRAFLRSGKHIDAIEQCLLESIDFDLREAMWDDTNSILVSLAIEKKYFSVFTFLVGMGAKVDSHVLETALYDAAQKTDHESIKFLLEHGVDANRCDHTPLHMLMNYTLEEDNKSSSDSDDSGYSFSDDSDNIFVERPHSCYAFIECVRLLRHHVSIFDSKWTTRAKSPLYENCANGCDLCFKYYGHHWEAVERALEPLLPNELVQNIQTFFDVTPLREKHRIVYDTHIKNDCEEEDY